jgi:hypothetical protein
MVPLDVSDAPIDVGTCALRAVFPVEIVTRRVTLLTLGGLGTTPRREYNSDDDERDEQSRVANHWVFFTHRT